MNTLLKIGQIISSLAFIGLGVLCLMNKDFIIGRPPKWDTTSVFLQTLAYLSGSAVIIFSFFILLRKKGFIAALTIASLIILLSISRDISVSMADWLNGLKSIAMLGGFLIIAASFSVKNRKVFIWTGSILLSAFFIGSGYAHFKFSDFVKDFIPSYIPFHTFFTYFTAICLLAGAVGILIPATRFWAALLSGIMLSGWFLLLHIPRFLMNMQDASDRMGLFESLGFAGFFFVLAALNYHNKVDR